MAKVIAFLLGAVLLITALATAGTYFLLKQPQKPQEDSVSMIKVIGEVSNLKDRIEELEKLGAFTQLNQTDRLTDFVNLYNTNLLPQIVQVGTTSVSSITALPNLVSVGTLTTGVWNGTPVTVPYGGTGSTTLSSGMLLVGNGTGIMNATSAPSNISYLYTTGASATSTFAGGVAVGGNEQISGNLFTLGTGTSTFGGDVTVSKNLSASNLAKGGLKTLNDGATITINWDDGNTQYVVLGGSRTIAFSNIKTGATMRLFLCQDPAGSRTLTWPTTAPFMRWASGVTPTLTTSANKCDIVSLVTSTSTATIFGAASLNY